MKVYLVCNPEDVHEVDCIEVWATKELAKERCRLLSEGTSNEYGWHEVNVLEKQIGEQPSKREEQLKQLIYDELFEQALSMDSKSLAENYVDSEIDDYTLGQPESELERILRELTGEEEVSE